jgi:hypothetical protein
VGGIVEREEIFAIGGVADGDGAGEFRGVEGVERLAELVEDVVGDVDDVVDGAETDGFETLFEPCGGILDGDAGDFDGGVEGAGGGGGNLDETSLSGGRGAGF